MNKAERKNLIKAYKEKQMTEFYDSLPMSEELFKKLFRYLNRQFKEQGCKENLDMTIVFLKKNDIPLSPVIKWLHDNGAGCDCEVLANIEERFEEYREFVRSRQREAERAKKANPGE